MSSFESQDGRDLYYCSLCGTQKLSREIDGHRLWLRLFTIDNPADSFPLISQIDRTPYTN
ncbi:hypothetical protein GCM10007874_72800 [Labrys miyagiensis]|uniref:Uncharacterized protein n=1 Tax=Labrys miyagiensis TaxID=346912 RepID=A0ABQ6CX50_9HYPH|nr:hypothetical protein GCM10007874_72800 [Labrys miyagiensis]